jgi:hypothetical protein
MIRLPSGRYAFDADDSGIPRNWRTAAEARLGKRAFVSGKKPFLLAKTAFLAPKSSKIAEKEASETRFSFREMSVFKALERIFLPTPGRH